MRERETDRQTERENKTSVCLSIFYRDEMSLMKSDNKNREREREREREFPERIRRRISVLLKSRPRFVEPKKTKKKVPLSEQTFYLFFGGKKMSHHKIIIILTNEFLSSLSPLSFYSININRKSLPILIRSQRD